MDSSDAATPNGIELTAVNSAPPGKQRRVHVNVTFCTHVGWDGALVMLFSLGIAGLFVYITFLYTKSFQAWHRPWVWLFMVFAVLYTLLTLWYLFTGKKIAQRFSSKKVELIGCAIIQFRNKFKINGVFFLWKFYLFEFIESINQIINLTTVYLCTLPVPITTSMCIVLAADAFYRAYQLKLPNTVARRDRQIKIDLVIDFLCVAVPLCTMWFAFKISISIPEMIQITVWPSLCIFSKLRSVLKEIIRVRTDNAILRDQKKISFEAGRSRKSMFRRMSSSRISNEQGNRMPKAVSAAFCIYNVGYGLFFLVVVVAQLGMFLNEENFIDCDKTTWEKGCENKIPFCKSMFTPTCNCASLKIENDYKLVALPNTLVDEMTGLRKVFIRNCNLTTLPPRMEQLTEMVDFEISFNRLEEFMVDVGKWEKLDRLSLIYNKLKTYNQTALWTHPHLGCLDVSDNIGMGLPTAETEIAMPSLLYFGCRNNSITVHLPFNKNRFPNLLHLYVNGNRLIEFPDASLQETLQYVGVARCDLKNLPSYLAEFKQLRYIDARDNNISVVNDDLKMLISKNQVESYFSDNPVCNTDATLDCAPLCSKYCGSKNVVADKYCHPECDSEECDYDGSDCF